MFLQVLQKRVGLLEAELRRKEKDLELLQEVSPGSSREAQVLRRKMRHSEEELATSRLKCKQLEEVYTSPLPYKLYRVLCLSKRYIRPLFHTNSIGYCVLVRGIYVPSSIQTL